MATFFPLFLAALGALFPAAPVIRHATATTHLGAWEQTGRYGAPLLFDGRDDTAFCEGAEGPGLGERVVVEFTRPVRVTRVRVALGDPMAFGRFMPANRPRAITLSNQRYTWQILAPDDPTPFELPLPPPITASQLVVRLDAVHDHGARHTCLAELTLFEGKEPLTLVPNAPHTTLPGPLPPSLEGPWTPAGEREPERFLVFQRDGHFRWMVHPNLRAGVLTQTEGEWRLTPERGVTRLAFVTPGVDPPLLGTVRFNVQPDGKPLLVLDGAYPGKYTPWAPGAD